MDYSCRCDYSQPIIKVAQKGAVNSSGLQSMVRSQYRTERLCMHTYAKSKS